MSSLPAKDVTTGRDRLIGNIQHGNDDAAALEGFALGDGRQGALIIDRGRAVAAGPGAVGNAFHLVVLCAVGDEEDVRLRGAGRAAVADGAGAAGDQGR